MTLVVGRVTLNDAASQAGTGVVVGATADCVAGSGAVSMIISTQKVNGGMSINEGDTAL